MLCLTLSAAKKGSLPNRLDHKAHFGITIPVGIANVECGLVCHCAMTVAECTQLMREVIMKRQFKIIVEKNPDGYVAYPLGLKGVVVGEGDTYEEAVADVTSAIKFHIETFGKEVLI